MKSADRSRLEAAASYIGLIFNPSVTSARGLKACDSKYQEDTFWWNPFEDDGQAFRLLIRAGLTLDVVFGPGGPAETSVWGETCFTHPHRKDALKASRRAIVCAAAELGGYYRKDKLPKAPATTLGQDAGIAAAFNQENLK